jgi:hypothetical protein
MTTAEYVSRFVAYVVAEHPDIDIFIRNFEGRTTIQIEKTFDSRRYSNATEFSRRELAGGLFRSPEREARLMCEEQPR